MYTSRVRSRAHRAYARSYVVLLKVIPSSKGSYLDPSKVQSSSSIPSSLWSCSTPQGRELFLVSQNYFSQMKVEAPPRNIQRACPKLVLLSTFCLQGVFSQARATKELANKLLTPMKFTSATFKWHMSLVGLSSGGGVLEVRGIGSIGFLHDEASYRESGGGSSIVSPMSSKKKQVFWSNAFWKALKMFILIFIFPKEIFITPVQQFMHALAVTRKWHPRMTGICYSGFETSSVSRTMKSTG